MPPAWLEPPVQFSATEFSQTATGASEFQAATVQIVIASRALPAGYFSAHPTRLFVLDGLRTHGRDATGAVWAEGRSVFVVNADDEELARRFHIQLGHLIFRTHQTSFPTKAWLRANPPGFKYTGNTDRASEDGVTMWALLSTQRGLYAGYGPRDIETDAALFFAALLSKDPEFETARQQHRFIDTKARLLIGFLGSVHPGFTPEWFGAVEATP
ncbi:MAG: hypothetical protein ACIAQU_06530 [Phycisphaerales bacterium JB064]